MSYLNEMTAELVATVVDVSLDEHSARLRHVREVYAFRDDHADRFDIEMDDGATFTVTVTRKS